MRDAHREIDRPDRPESARQPESQERQTVRTRDRSYQLNDQELQTLRTVGTFRTVNAQDISDRETKRLIEAGLIQKTTVYPRTDAPKLDVLVLSSEGERVVLGRQSLDDEQRFHSGLVKIKELAHDAAIYPAYKDAKEQIERAGGKVDRVVLDAEFKSVINSQMNRGGSVSGEAREERQAKLAAELDLEIVNGKLPLPDLRIEYTDEHGERHHQDIEIVSRHYHGAHLVGKASAGFKMVSNERPHAAVPDHHGTRLV